MLRELHIRNLAIIEEVGIEFERGLNVLSGETGAGKSIVVDALGLLGGARADGDAIRAGAETLSVIGRFEPAGALWRQLLAAAGLHHEGDELVVRREVSRSGRNRVYLDDQPVTLRLLGELAPSLLRIHTQREELGLVSSEMQRDWLDRSAGAEGSALAARVTARFNEVEDAVAKLERLAGDEKLRFERIDLLRFQIAEIDRARPSAGEEEQLRLDRDLLRNAEQIAGALAKALALLYDDDESAIDRLGHSARALEDISAWTAEADSWLESLAGMRAGLEDIVAELRAHLARAEADPARLNEVEDRLATLERLFRKYGATSHEVLSHRARIEDELGDLTAGEENRAELEAKVAAALAGYRDAALELPQRRLEWGAALAARVHRELADLAMAKAEFSVLLQRRRRQGSRLVLEGHGVDCSARGIDQVEFQVRANPGEAAGPVSKVASGGELARLYLALQLAVGTGGRAGKVGGDGIEPVLVFDEVDAGIGGAEAAALGRKLQRLAGSGQILVVTHLAQVASYAGCHVRVRKWTRGGRTRIAVDRLSESKRVEEVARMLAGEEITDLSRSHAEELIAAAR